MDRLLVEENCNKVKEVGGKPYFKCKKSWNGKQGGCLLWKIMNQESKDSPLGKATDKTIRILK